ncbi:MAG: hypothetical protein JWO05_1015 [Gemmatimonadetes bacterium]|nr:hypothetical protein [Gemmatimonadota bacterium]
MGHYTKLGVLVMRSMGLMILFYAVPIVLYGVARAAMVPTAAPDGSMWALLVWAVYALAGVLLLLLAQPLARIAARGLDQPTSVPSAPEAP